MTFRSAFVRRLVRLFETRCPRIALRSMRAALLFSLLERLTFDNQIEADGCTGSSASVEEECGNLDFSRSVLANFVGVECLMNSDVRNLQVLLIVVVLSIPCGFAQKIKVGYDKSVDFSKYKTYTLKVPPQPASRPLLYASVVGSIKNGLESKGLVSKDKGGDLTVIAGASLDYGLNPDTNPIADDCANCQAPQVDVQMWAGFMPPPGSAGKPQPRGTLKLDMVDRATNKEVWSGMVVQKLDAQKVDQSLEKVGTAIDKLMMEFPPKAK